MKQRNRRRIKRLVLALCLVLFVPLAGGRAAASVPLDELTVTTTQLAFGLERPTAIAAPDDGTGRLFVTEKAGRVRVYDPASGLAEDPLLDISDRVDATSNERGLLGILPAPDFAESRVLYVAYTALDGAATLARYGLADDALDVVLSQPHSENTNHNGGQLAFGPDGYLYWGIGDGGGADDVPGNSQNLDTLLGKILRIDVGAGCGDASYCVPDDNPFVGVEGARPEIWVYGVRNPWRFSFDSVDGSLWIGDVGQGQTEEVDHLTPDQGGADMGWPCREGDKDHQPERCPQGTEFTEPVFTYQTSTQGCAVIGGFVYHGKEHADLADGTYLAGDYCSSTAWAVREGDDGTYANGELGTLPTQVTAIGQDTDGELYMVNDLPGQLHRIDFEQVSAGAGD